MSLAPIDWFSIVAFFALSFVIGFVVLRRAGTSTAEFFLSGRSMPWWLLGVSMVATTFSADTPNLVTDIVRQNGVAGNWVWWAFLLTGMLTVFVYAKLWRRSGVLTDLEFYEIRYSGRAAAFLRGFRALYLGVFFNVLIMASVSLALVKFAGVILDVDPVVTLIVASVVTVSYSAMGGLRGVIVTDFFQFAIALFGAVAAAMVALNLPDVGGLDALLSHPLVSARTSFFPDINARDAWITIIVLPLAVQWWSVWYPGSEPGGGGYIAQRMLSAKSEGGAVKAALFFNFAHYALRPWPWIIVALASLVVFPDLESLQAAFPNIGADVIGHDLAYPAMLTFLPAGLLGLVVASLIAAFMSTISTHLNWGSSYIVHDFYRRFIRPDASEKQLVAVGRLSTIGLMVLSGGFALLLTNALQAFNILLQVGAGTGLLFILRWFWWRINPWSEIAAMVVSFIVAVVFAVLSQSGFELPSSSVQLLLGVGITTLAWIGVTLATPPSDEDTLRKFCALINAGGPGWRKYATASTTGDGSGWSVPSGLMAMLAGSVSIYSLLFAIGLTIYGEVGSAFGMALVAVGAAVVVVRLWPKLQIR
ncbi:MAG: Na+:solute symporter [Rhodothermales bacterium]|nr:Na+:solute symporter [Rhodothermales bacterium]